MVQEHQWQSPLLRSLGTSPQWQNIEGGGRVEAEARFEREKDDLHASRDTLQVGTTTKRFFGMKNEQMPRPKKLNGERTLSSRELEIGDHASSFRPR